ncbi:hypothetical protein C0992_003159 [Termitomyces sp. T32_za158]|nr:hypothetical protein C0992_003159 [Termitomyces sp. T32_za158]
MVHFSAAEALSIGADAIHLKNRPLPDAPTGYYDWEITTDPSDDREGHSRVTNLIDRLESIKAKGLFKPKLSQVDAFFDSVMHPMAVDDRKGAFTTGLGILARLDPNGDLAKKMNNGLIDMLYNTVPHPPAAYVGPRHSFRRADGGGNNLLNPDLGRAGMPYARSVQGKAGLPRTSLPDAGLVFDTILKRKGYIAKKILKINECRRWSDPPPADPEKLALQDEEIFQTARLIKTNDLKVDRGLGNHVSVEFNVIYRWHATISAKSEKWTEDAFRKVFGDKPFEELSLKDIGMLSKALEVTSEPSERTFAGLKRGPDGTFSDDDLAEILYASTESPAGAFRGRGTPTVLRLVEILGIEQSRAWGVCTMNEFRKFMGLRGFKTFEEWNPDPEIATGLQAESTIPLTDTFRFACGYTITRAILGDAIALVRGDRFYTSDFTPNTAANLTTWGFYDCQRDMNNGGLGGQIPKLLLRHLPRHFPWEKSWKYPNVSGHYVDIVKDVINAVAAHVAADKVTGIPLKTTQSPSGIFTENEFFDMLTILVSFFFQMKLYLLYSLNIPRQYTVTFLVHDQPENHFSIQEAATRAEMMIEALTARSLIEISPSASPNCFGGLIARVSSFFRPPKEKPWYPFLSALTATGRPVDELIGNIISIAIAAVGFAHAAVNVIDFYLADARTEERKAIVELVKNKGPQSETLLSGYVREAMRLQPQYSGLWRGAAEDAIIDQGPGYPPLEVKAGDRIWASLRNAYLNPVDFPEPTKVIPTRQAASYYLDGTVFRHCPDEASVHKTIVEIVKVVFSLKNVRRAPGDAGDLHRLSEILHKTEVDSFVQRNGTIGPWPGSMYIVWPPNYPNTTAEYFLSLDSVLDGNTPGSKPHKKSLNDIYMGVDVWGRGSHGGGGFGSYKAITHIAPDSLGLSVALFGPGWTWESEQDRPGFSWEKWWEYDRKLWVGPISGEVQVPKVSRREGEPECVHGPFQPIASFFPHNSPPDPLALPFHTTFSPGVGRAWFVNGISVYRTTDGWTDIDKQCSIGDLLWPLPAVCWDDGERISPLPQVLPAICFEDAWNGGSSIRLDISCSGSEEEDAMFRNVWIPIQTLSLTPGTIYKATLYYKVIKSGQADLDLGFSVKSGTDATLIEVQPIGNSDSELPGNWTELSIQLAVSTRENRVTKQTSAIGLIVAIIAEDPTQDLDIELRIGQLNIYPMPPTTVAHHPIILWADFTEPDSQDISGLLSWEVGASFPPLTPISITSPNDPISAWPVQPSNDWFPRFMYYNIYGLPHSQDGLVSQPEEAVWIGTTGLVGQSRVFQVGFQELPFWSSIGIGKCTKVRFYIQGVTDHGTVLEWEKCVFVDADLQSILA